MDGPPQQNGPNHLGFVVRLLRAHEVCGLRPQVLHEVRPVSEKRILRDGPAQRLAQDCQRLAGDRDCHFVDTPPLPSEGVSMGMERGCLQNDNLADGYQRQLAAIQPSRGY